MDGFVASVTFVVVVAWFFAGVFLTVLAHTSLYAFYSLYLSSLGYGKGDIGLLWSISVVVESLRNFNGMQIGPFDVLQAQGLEIDAQRRGVALLAEACAARLDLEELLAGSANDARLAADGHMGDESARRNARGGH